MISYYELARLIKEGKQPKIIKHLGRVYEFEDGLYVTPKKSYKVALGGLENEINIFANIFNENIEVIEEIKKSNIPQKISFKTTETQKEKNRLIKDTINQIIDCLEKSDKE